MFKQIIVAMAGAIAAQLTAATLDLTPADRHGHYEQPASPARLAVMPVTSQDFFALPGAVATIAPFLGPTQIANRE